MNLNDLAAFAVKNNFNRASGGTPIHELSIEEARERVVVRDGNKKAKEDGSQALTLAFGKYALALDVVSPGATRINATKEQVEGFTEALLNAVKDGEFDEEIIAAQAKAKVQAETPRKPRAAKAAPVEEKVDLEALDAIIEEEELPVAEDDLDDLG